MVMMVFILLGMSWMTRAFDVIIDEVAQAVVRFVYTHFGSMDVHPFTFDEFAQAFHGKILTNGKYQSIEHRVTVNAHKERMSISAFHLPKFDTSVGPLSGFVKEDEKKYKTLRVDEVAKVVFSSKLDGKKTKDYAMFSI